MGIILQQQNTSEELTGLSYSAPFIFWGTVLLLFLIILILVIKNTKNEIVLYP